MYRNVLLIQQPFVSGADRRKECNAMTPFSQSQGVEQSNLIRPALDEGKIVSNDDMHKVAWRRERRLFLIQIRFANEGIYFLSLERF